MGNVSSSLSNGEGGQFFPLQRCQLEGPHLHRNVEVCSERENEQIINYCRHRDVFAHTPLYRICKNFINVPYEMILCSNGKKITINSSAESRGCEERKQKDMLTI